MCGRKSEFEQRGTRIVFVGPAQPYMALSFTRTFGCGIPVLADPESSVFRELQLKRSAARLLNPRMLLNALRAFRAGFRQTKLQGHPLQQGGAVLFGADGTIHNLIKDLSAGDKLDIDSILCALDVANAANESRPK